MSSFRSRIAALGLAVGLFGASTVDAQRAELSVDGPRAVHDALARHPGFLATTLERRRAEQHVRAELARYSLNLHLEGNLNVGQTPSLTVGNVILPYNESINVVAELNRTFDFGTTVALRATGSRLFRRVNVIPTSPMVVAVGPGYGLDVALTITQPFLRGLGDQVGQAELRQARASLDQTTAARLRRANELVRDTLVSYAELWYAEESVTINHSARELAARERDETHERVAIGVLAATDELAFATRVASMEEAVALAEADRRSRALVLAALLGVPADTDVHAEATPPSVGIPVTDEAAVPRAMAESPQLAELQAQLEAARRASEVASEPLRPRLDAQAQLAVHGLGYDDVGQAFSQVGTFGAFTALVGLVYEGPLDDTQLREESERAALAIDVVEARIREAELTLEQEVRTLLETRRAARRRIELATETVSLAERTVEAERERVSIGSSTTTSRLRAEDDLRSAQLRLRRAQVDLITADVRLASYTEALLVGVELPD